MFKTMFSKLLDYVAYVVLGLVGLIIANMLYIAWFTDTGRAVLSGIIILISISWAIVRVLKKR